MAATISMQPQASLEPVSDYSVAPMSVTCPISSYHALGLGDAFTSTSRANSFRTSNAVPAAAHPLPIEPSMGLELVDSSDLWPLLQQLQSLQLQQAQEQQLLPQQPQQEAPLHQLTQQLQQQVFHAQQQLLRLEQDEQQLRNHLDTQQLQQPQQQQQVLLAQQRLLQMEQEEQQLRQQLKTQPLRQQQQQQHMWGPDQLKLLRGGAAAAAAAADGTGALATAAPVPSTVMLTRAMLPSYSSTAVDGSAESFTTAPMATAQLAYVPPAAAVPGTHTAGGLGDPEGYLQELFQVQLSYQQQQEHQQQQQLYESVTSVTGVASRAPSSSCLSRVSLASLDEDSEGWGLEGPLDSFRKPLGGVPQQQQLSRSRRTVRSATWGSDRFTNCQLSALAEITEEEEAGEAVGGQGRYGHVSSGGSRGGGRKGLPTKRATWGAGIFQNRRAQQQQQQLPSNFTELSRSGSNSSSRRPSVDYSQYPCPPNGFNHVPRTNNSSRRSSVDYSQFDPPVSRANSGTRKSCFTQPPGGTGAAAAADGGVRNAGKGEKHQRMEPPKWAGEFWNPLAEAVKSGQLANGGTGVFIPRSMQAALEAQAPGRGADKNKE